MALTHGHAADERREHGGPRPTLPSSRCLTETSTRCPLLISSYLTPLQGFLRPNCLLCEQDPRVLGSCLGHHLPPLQVPQSKSQPPGGFQCSGITGQGQPGVSEGGVRTWFLPPWRSLPRSLLSRPRNPPGGRKCPLISLGSFILLGLALFTWLKQTSHRRKLS